MPRPRLTRLELQILEILWTQGNASIREIQEAFPAPRPAYTTIQTTVYRLETKQAVRRARKISNAHIFEPLVAREDARRRLLDEVLSFFGGRAQPMMAQLVEAGRLTRDDLREIEKAIEAHEKEKHESTHRSAGKESPMIMHADGHPVRRRYSVGFVGSLLVHVALVAAVLSQAGSTQPADPFDARGGSGRYDPAIPPPFCDPVSMAAIRRERLAR